METQTKTLTKEEYLALTNIKSVEEARDYIKQLRVLFIAVMISIAIPENIAIPAQYLIYVGLGIGILWIYFLFFCRKVIKAEKIADTSYLFSIFFAPISWIWFYPAIMEPLQIITGDKQLPEDFNVETFKEKMAAKEKANKSFTSFMLKFILGAIIFLVVLFAFLVIVFK